MVIVNKLVMHYRRSMTIKEYYSFKWGDIGVGYLNEKQTIPNVLVVRDNDF